MDHVVILLRFCALGSGVGFCGNMVPIPHAREASGVRKLQGSAQTITCGPRIELLPMEMQGHATWNTVYLPGAIWAVAAGMAVVREVAGFQI